MPRGVLVQKHPRKRPARPLLAVRRATRRRLHQSRTVQVQLGHRIAQLVAVPLHQLLVEVLDREVGIVFAIEPEHAQDLVLAGSTACRSAGRRGPTAPRPAADPASGGTFARSPPASPPPRSGSTRPARDAPTTLRTASCGSPAAPPPGPFLTLDIPASSDSKTGQITRYKLRTDHELATLPVCRACTLLPA